MVMRLLSPPQGKSRLASENASQEIRAQELDKLIVAKRKELNDLDNSFVFALSTKGIQNYEDEQKYKEKIKILTSEVESLEKRKERALLPIKERENDLLQNEQNLTHREDSLVLRETNLERESELILTRLSDVEKREQYSEKQRRELDTRNREIDAREKNSILTLEKVEMSVKEAEQKERETREVVATLDTEVSILRQERKELLIPIEERERSLDNRSAALTSRENSITIREIALIADKKELASRVTAVERVEAELEAIKTSQELENARLMGLSLELVAREQKHGRTVIKAFDRLKIEQEKAEVRILEADERTKEYERLRDTNLIPLENREKAVHTKESALLKREESIEIKESTLESDRELLEERLDDISEREQTALDHAASLEKRAHVISLEEAEVKNRQNALVTIVRQVSEDKKKSEQEINNQKAILKGREVVISEREAIVAKKEAGFAAREKKILDQYRSLQKAITETNLKTKNVERSPRTK